MSKARTATRLSVEHLEERSLLSIRVVGGNIEILVPPNTTENSVVVTDTFRWQAGGKKVYGYSVINNYKVGTLPGQEKKNFIPASKITGDRIIFKGGESADHFQYTQSSFVPIKVLKVEAYGYGGKDTLKGWVENDTLYGGNKTDHLYGGGGNDQIHGDAGLDFLHGEEGKDTLYGGAGPDTLHAGDDFDVDWLYGEGEVDTLPGDGETDTFQIMIPEDYMKDYDPIEDNWAPI
jgi:Ca2+-binding RTX toxin-like protein